MAQQQSPEPQSPGTGSIRRPLPQRPLRVESEATKRFLGRVLLVGYVLLCVIVALTSYQLKARDDDRFQRLQHVCVVTRAHVTNQTSVGHGSFRLAYQFTATTPKGTQRLFRNSAITQRSTLIAASDFNIIYDPADPTISVLKDDLRRPDGVPTRMLPFCFLGFPFSAGGLLLILIGTCRLNLARALEQRGAVVQGVVVDRWYQRGKREATVLLLPFPYHVPTGGRIPLLVPR